MSSPDWRPQLGEAKVDIKGLVYIESREKQKTTRGEREREGGEGRGRRVGIKGWEEGGEGGGGPQSGRREQKGGARGPTEDRLQL